MTKVNLEQYKEQIIELVKTYELKDIASLFNCNKASIYYNLNKWGVHRRD